MVFIGLILLSGFLFGFTQRWWIVLPLAAVLPVTSLWAAGAFDDGEGVATFATMSLVLTFIAGIGLLASHGMQRALESAT